jgi:hypothetical protein
MRCAVRFTVAPIGAHDHVVRSVPNRPQLSRMSGEKAGPMNVRLFNEGITDRAIRVVLGLALIYAGTRLAGVGAIIVYIVAGVSLATGVVGVCPGYALLGIRTCPLPPTPPKIL